MNVLGPSFKSAISKWCRVKIKRIKMPGKDKKIKDHLFDSGKCQFTFHQLVNKIDEIIGELKTEDELNLMIAAQVSPITDALTAHEGLAWGAAATEDVNIIGKSPSGLNIYTFRFTDSYRYGDGLYQGVMSDEVPQSVVTQDNHGYDMVDYGKIDVDFVKISDIK